MKVHRLIIITDTAGSGVPLVSREDVCSAESAVEGLPRPQLSAAPQPLEKLAAGKIVTHDQVISGLRLHVRIVPASALNRASSLHRAKSGRPA